MFLLVFCLVGSAVALPAIPQAPILPAEGEQPMFISSPYTLMAYPAPLEMSSLKPLEIMIEPEPKEESAELPEPSEEPSKFPEEPKEIDPEMPKEPALEEQKPLEPETVVIKLDIPKPPAFISDWFSFLPSFKPPQWISNLFSPSSELSTNLPPRILYPAVVVVDEVNL